jgi:DNA-binding NarL/FixJ family response regulator
VARRCLIVDDNEPYLSRARSLLEDEGMDVVGVASNTRDALELNSQLEPEIVLVDIDLGEENGLDLARLLADEPIRPKVILISAYPERDFRELIEESPAIGFVPKANLSQYAIEALLTAPSG